jgi:hypothetical protein
VETFAFIFFIIYPVSAVIVTSIMRVLDEVIEYELGILVAAAVVNSLGAYLAYRLADVSTSSTRYTILYCIWGYLLISWLLAARKVWRHDVVKLTRMRCIIIDLMMVVLMLAAGSLASNW